MAVEQGTGGAAGAPASQHFQRALPPSQGADLEFFSNQGKVSAFLAGKRGCGAQRAEPRRKVGRGVASDVRPRTDAFSIPLTAPKIA